LWKGTLLLFSPFSLTRASPLFFTSLSVDEQPLTEFPVLESSSAARWKISGTLFNLWNNNLLQKEASLPHSCCRLVSFISSTYLICCLSCLFACIPNTKVTTTIPHSSYLHFNSQNHSSFITLYTLKHLDLVINDPSSVYFVCIACFTVTQWLLRTHHHGHSHLRNHTLFTYHISFILSLSYITINPFKISFLQHTQLS